MQTSRAFYFSVFYAVFLITFFGSCSKLPLETKGFQYTTFDVPNGPEDFVLDTSDLPRLIVSCGIKRKQDASKGEFVSIYLNSHHIQKMKVFMPDSISLFPHGIDLLRQNDSLVLLAVNHEKQCGKNGRNSVIRFLLKNDRLYFIQQITSHEMKNPNAVCGLPDGSFFISNMYTKGIFSKGNVTYCRDGKCEAASDKISYANGVAYHNNHLLVASTLENKIYIYKNESGKLSDKKVLAKLRGGDNLRVLNDVLYCAAHFNIRAFLQHIRNPVKHAPSAVFSKNLSTGQESLIYFNKGSTIDASSTALVFRDKLYITGVFNPKVVELSK